MSYASWSGAVLSRKRPQLKWRALDPLEFGLIALCGLLLLGFLVSELGDVVFRILLRPWLDAQEFSLGFFVWGVFMGAAVGVRRNDHFRLAASAEVFSGGSRTAVETFQQLVMIGVALAMVWYGYVNFLHGFGSYLMPSLTPVAVLYAAIPVCGALIALFSVEKLVNGWRHGFPDPLPNLPPGVEPIAPQARR
ncbi:MAG: TRAP transporter small permease [Acetobacteraceae bacterium]